LGIAGDRDKEKREKWEEQKGKRKKVFHDCIILKISFLLKNFAVQILKKT